MDILLKTPEEYAYSKEAYYDSEKIVWVASFYS